MYLHVLNMHDWVIADIQVCVYVCVCVCVCMRVSMCVKTDLSFYVVLSVAALFTVLFTN